VPDKARMDETNNALSWKIDQHDLGVFPQALLKPGETCRYSIEPLPTERGHHIRPDISRVSM